MPRPRLAFALLATALLPSLCGASACGSSTGATTTLTPVTSVVVDPVEFLDGVACLDQPGAMRRYVATLVDVSTFSHLRPPLPIDHLELPSSAPTPCFLAVEFQRVTIGREYVAHVEGYDRDDIAALSPGSPIMVDRVSGAFVPPRWQTWCGGRPPSLVGGTHDGGLSSDGGSSVDAGSAPTSIPSLDGGFLDCPRRQHPDGSAPPAGPVCVYDELAITVRGCEPLSAPPGLR
jgi:hypothetical protein